MRFPLTVPDNPGDIRVGRPLSFYILRIMEVASRLAAVLDIDMGGPTGGMTIHVMVYNNGAS
jgi:hypothetical protein